MQHVEMTDSHQTATRLSIGLSTRQIKKWSPFQRTVIPARADGTEGQREKGEEMRVSAAARHQIKLRRKDSGGMKGRVKSYGLYGIPSR